SLLKNSFSDSLLPVTSFPDSAPVAGFPPVAEDRSVAELGIFQQTVKPHPFKAAGHLLRTCGTRY
ncbi:MAG TPA: hypothetical protein VN948_00075, partial [Terriglobales bacterium]|nr:hypothetical protein [Terriglobales bacterium]